MRTLFLMVSALLMMGASAQAGSCDPFAGAYANSSMKLEIEVDSTSSLLTLRYNTGSSIGVFSFIADGVNHDGDGRLIGKPYNASCTGNLIFIKETFAGRILVRELRLSGSMLTQTGRINGHPAIPMHFERIQN